MDWPETCYGEFRYTFSGDFETVIADLYKAMEGVSLMTNVFDSIQRSSTVGELLYSGECSNKILNLFTAGLYEDHTALCNGYLSRVENMCEIASIPGNLVMV